MLSANQIHKKSNTDIPFSVWIDAENADYQDRIRTGKISGRNGFLFWLNKKYENMLAGDGSLTDTITSIFSKTSEKYLGRQEGDNSGAEPESPKTILGLKPVVVYSIAGLAVLVTAYIIIKKTSK